MGNKKQPEPLHFIRSGEDETVCGRAGFRVRNKTREFSTWDNMYVANGYRCPSCGGWVQSNRTPP
ncbi:hypothetical protein SAMN04488504_11411 [Myxococcus virescens]|uniref:Uncharacterized protein n=1 Tax=Myxococcus virescens TaxID=83456 RepID=A0ABY0N348_9BACT|nr:hypothetical protein SAMN04488504_11411 [Myxococcus virescens]